MNLDFYVTPLDSFCSLVLGYNWLAQYNSLIDWVNRSINFCLSLQENLTPSHVTANTPLVSPSILEISLQLLDFTISIPVSEISMSNSEQPNITIIGATVFLHTSKLLGSKNFKLHLYSLDIQANSAKLAEVPDLSNILSKYYKFANVFSKIKAEVLPSHCSYDLKINLYTLFQHLNKRLWKNSLRKISTQVSSNQPHLCMVHQSYLLRRKMVHCAFMLTSMVLTISSRKIAIHFRSSLIYWTHLAKLESTQR